MFGGCCLRSDVRESRAVISGNGATSPLLPKLDLQREGRSGCWCYCVVGVSGLPAIGVVQLKLSDAQAFRWC